MIQIRKLEHNYGPEKIFSIPEWDIQEGEHWVVLGKSGSGKTTLLHLIAGLLRPQTGSIQLLKNNLEDMSSSKMDQFRARHIGIIFQKPHLVNSLRVKHNLVLAQFAAGLRQDPSYCSEILQQLDLGHRANAFPAQLSEGEKQRVSVGRAILNQPQIILADEPTASLDDDNAFEVIRLLKTQAHRNKSALIIATHDQRVKDHFDLQYQL
ncbi:MAG: ATP-binding cassette domain-containing protein [Bacteroidota bacterium]